MPTLVTPALDYRLFRFHVLTTFLRTIEAYTVPVIRRLENSDNHRLTLVLEIMAGFSVLAENCHSGAQ
jgi:hypothetical protein